MIREMEHKFKAWDKINKKMFQVNNIETIMGKTVYRNKKGDISVTKDDGVLMQWSMLRDIRNKEIYNHDIIASSHKLPFDGRDPKNTMKHPSGYLFRIIFHEGGFMYQRVGNRRAKKHRLDSRAIRLNGFYVVGNKYKTPKLMDNHKGYKPKSDVREQIEKLVEHAD